MDATLLQRRNFYMLCKEIYNVNVISNTVSANG